MFLRTLLGVLTIVAATSCVPEPVEYAAPVRRQIVSDPKQLLRKLDLAVPDDVAALAARPESAADLLALPNAAPAFLATARSEDDRARASDCLTAAIYYEARSEPLDGQRAVAQVVLNRVRDRAFPNTVCGVVYQGHLRRTGCQFSFTCDGSMQRRRDPRSWEEARLVAEAALAGYVYAPAGSATHYHANYMVPWWAPSLTRIGEFGSQIFYRWRSGMERVLAFRQHYAGFEPEIGAADFIPMPEVAGGVTVHFGGETVDGSVIVHHDATPDGAVIPVARMTMSGGVRVHRDVDAPDSDDPGDASATLTEDGA